MEDRDIQNIIKAGEKIMKALSACEKKYGGGVTTMALRGVICSHFTALSGCGIINDEGIVEIFDQFAADIRSDMNGLLEEEKAGLH